MGGILWTEERVEILTKLRGDKLSASEIGAELGVSRNAVIGKLHRLRMTTERKPRATPAPRNPINRIRRSKRTGLEILHRMNIPSVPLPEQTRQELTPRNIAYLDLKPNHCRYIVDGRDDHGLALSCGHPKVPGFNYCLAHCQIMFPTFACQPVEYREAAE